MDSIESSRKFCISDESSATFSAIRFKASQEIVENILTPRESPSQLQQPFQTQTLPNSPLQNIEDFNWRKEFLQGGFFNRKPSSSIEGNKTSRSLSNSQSSSVLNANINSAANQLNYRIGVTDGSPTASSNLVVSNAPYPDGCSVGAWKLIKGRVSQAMEDIKSSKNSSPSLHQKDEDSDGVDSSSFTLNSETISENYIIPSPTISALPIGYNITSFKSQHKYFGFGRPSNKSDSDSNEENETQTAVEDFIDSKSLRKSFANLKTKAKTHLSGTTTSTSSVLSTINSNKRDTLHLTSESLLSKISTSVAETTLTSIVTSTSAPIFSSSTFPQTNLGSTIRSSFLRNRNKKKSLDNPKCSILPTSSINNEENKQTEQNKNQNIDKHFEIESGVEMFEDMNIPNVVHHKHSIKSYVNINLQNENNSFNEGLKISSSSDTIEFKKPNPTINALLHQNTVPNLNKKEQNLKQEKQALTECDKNVSKKEKNKNMLLYIQEIITELFLKISTNSNYIITCILLMLLLAPIADFFRGVIACLCVITLFNTFSECFWNIIILKLKYICTKYLNSFIKSDVVKSGYIIGPQRCNFEIPDYKSDININKIPVVEEHKSLKVYSGWMNEINNYDPNNFHQSMTRSVYIRLDGALLRILNTSTRIPKRALWNETQIEKKNIIFTCSRTFNLIGAKVEMLPKGLARKRYFSKKYPLQLVIKKNEKLLMEENALHLSYLENIQTSSNINLTKMNSKINSQIGENQDNLSKRPVLKPPSFSLADNNRSIIHQSSNESNEGIRKISCEIQKNDIDFGATLLNSDLQKLQDTQDPFALTEIIPCGHETRILLFARCDREKEDWYRRFNTASLGAVHDQDLKIPDVVVVADEEISRAVKLKEENLIQNNNIQREIKFPNTNGCDYEKNSVTVDESEIFDGLLFSTDAARNPPEYINFMARYQQACSQKKIPVVNSSLVPNETPTRKNRRQKREEDDLWKGINQLLHLGPSGSMVWANVLIGRILFSCLNDSELLEKIQDFLQKKLAAIRLPSFMEDVSIAHINLGDTPPLIHRVSQPHLDERGIWIDADVTYEGLMHMTLTTKLNLLRLKRSQHGDVNTNSQHNTKSSSTGNNATSNSCQTSSATENKNTFDQFGLSNSYDENYPFVSQERGNLNSKNNLALSGVLDEKNSHITTFSNNNENKRKNQIKLSANNVANTFNANDNEGSEISKHLRSKEFTVELNRNSFVINSAIYDSNAESTGVSSSESESPIGGSILDIASESQSFHPTSGNSRRFLRIVDRITASNIFQSATEISYVQRAMENMSTKITLRVELKGLVSKVVFNIPPPPSDRIWLAFRGPPRLWVSAKPAVGDHAFDWSVVTNVIENKLCDEVFKYLVYPNMVDIIVPFLGQSTYKE